VFGAGVLAQLQLKGLTKRFGQITAVDDVSLDIGSGEFVTLVGPSGCGKTTLLRVIAGFTKPDAGELMIDSRSINGLPPRLRNIGYVFQSYALFPTMTVAENIGFSLRLQRRSKSEIAARVAELCDLTRLIELENRYPHELSGGQQQRVALARALAPEPSILLLDEPLSALDAKIRAFLRAEIRSVVQRLGITTVYVTHDQEEALSMSDRVVVMDRGRFLQAGTPLEIYTEPKDSFVAQFIGTSNRMRGKPMSSDKVMVEGKSLDVEVPDHLRKLETCLVCVRPEHITLSNTTAGDDETFEGTLGSFAFQGQNVLATIITPSNSPILVSVETMQWLALNLRVGDNLTWRIESGQAMIFAEGANIMDQF
jgi:putative spermidine/putrescine transport system ATP-binding protein